MEAEVKIKKKDGSAETVKYGPQEKYDAQNTVQIKLKLNKKTDADILDWLDGLDNKQGTIKSILRKTIKDHEMFWKMLKEIGKDDVILMHDGMSPMEYETYEPDEE